MAMEMTCKVMGADAGVMDGLLFLVGMNFLSIGFHVFALYRIFKGFSAARLWKDLEAEGKA